MPRATSTAKDALEAHLKNFPLLELNGAQISADAAKAYLFKKAIQEYSSSKNMKQSWRGGSSQLAQLPESLRALAPTAEQLGPFKNNSSRDLETANVRKWVKAGLPLVHQFATEQYTEGYRSGSTPSDNLSPDLEKIYQHVKADNSLFNPTHPETHQPLNFNLESYTNTLRNCPLQNDNSSKHSQSAATNLQALHTLHKTLCTQAKTGDHKLSQSLLKEYEKRRKALQLNLVALRKSAVHAHAAKDALAKQSGGKNADGNNSVSAFASIASNLDTTFTGSNGKEWEPLLKVGDLTRFDPSNNSKMTTKVQMQNGQWVDGVATDSEGKELEWDDEAMELFLKEILENKDNHKILKKSTFSGNFKNLYHFHDKIAPSYYENDFDITRHPNGAIAHIGFKNGAAKIHALKHTYAPILRKLQQERGNKSASAKGHAADTEPASATLDEDGIEPTHPRDRECGSSGTSLSEEGAEDTASLSIGGPGLG